MKGQKLVKIIVSYIMVVTFLVTALPFSARAEEKQYGKLSNGDEYVVGELIITFSDEVQSDEQAEEIAATYGCEINEFFQFEFGKVVGMTIINGADTLETKAAMEKDPLIRYVDLNSIIDKDIVGGVTIADEEDKKAAYSGLNIDWDNLIPGKDYEEDNVIVTFIDELDDQSIIYEVARSCGCEADEILMWKDYEGGKVVHMVITDGSSVKEMIERLEENEFVKYAEINGISAPDVPNIDNQTVSKDKDYGAWKRLAGDTRYKTMKKISEEGWDNGDCSIVIVATGSNFPDALAGSSLAGIYDCPIILTNSQTLSTEAQSEIVRLGASHVIVLGSSDAVSTSVENSIKAIVGNSNVTRLQGSTRFETCEQIYEYGAGNWSNTVILATGSTAPDALSISAYAFASKSPIFLVQSGTTLRPDLQSAISSGAFDNVVILGAPEVISTSLETWCENQVGSSHVIRLYGADRFQTSSQISSWASGNMTSLSVQPETILTYKHPAVAHGGNDHFADSLAGGPLSGHNGSVMLLTRDDTTSNYTVTNNIIPHTSDISLGYVLGAENVLSSTFYSWLNSLVAGS